ncbi:hypothetical protein [Schlesneria sp. T3-172]|uniref:hypothetical protein n=1 Tax=Schlesneria sphaerica TaxID=3373610 RepID=UPI0037C78823
MPRTRQFVLMVVATTITATAVLMAHACPYCPPTDSTLSEKLAESDSACVVKFLNSENGEELSMQKTTFEVLKAIRDSQKAKLEPKIVTPFGLTAKEGDLFLLMGQLKEDQMEWSLPIEMDELGREYDYIRKAPSHEQPQVERLEYFLKFLDHENNVISNDAFSEFAQAKYEDVELLAPKISRSQVRKWLEDPNPQLIVRRAFYGMLLGLCGNDEDADYLHQRIMAPIDPTQNRIGIEGMMGGYLLLRGESGLRELMERKLGSLEDELSPDDPRIADLDALRTTLIFLWDYRRRQFGEETLKAAMRRFLDRSEFADMVVVDLARWKDWVPLERLKNDYGKYPWDTRSAKEKIVAYALMCRKDVPAEKADQLPAHAVKAQSFLDSLDPEFVQSVKRGLGGFVPPAKPSKTKSTATPTN